MLDVSYLKGEGPAGRKKSSYSSDRAPRTCRCLETGGSVYIDKGSKGLRRAPQSSVHQMIGERQ